MELGEQLKAYRQKVPLSQEELANRVYVSRQTISNWENNKTYPDVNSLVLLSEVFQVSLPDAFLFELNRPVKKNCLQKSTMSIFPSKAFPFEGFCLALLA